MIHRLFGTLLIVSICAFGFLLLANCSHQSKRRLASDSYRKVDLNNLSFPRVNEDLSFEELKRILEAKNFSKISDLLGYLSHEKPEYMSRYTLGYASKSLHGSSYENPRAIVYGKSGHFIISFNGRADQNAYEMLEVMSFNDDTKQFEFYEIEFNEDRMRGAPFSISENGGPQNKCIGCHVGGRPIWSFYDMWPGFYGAADDYPIAQNNKTGGDSIFFGVKVPPGVLDQWLKFQSAAAEHPRYKNLGAPALSPLTGRDSRPNADLSALLYFRNLERIEKLLIENGSRDQRRYALLYGLFCADSTYSLAFKENMRRFEKSAKVQHRAFLKNQVLEHIRELGLSWTDIQQQYLLDSENADLKSTSKEDFVKKLVAKDKFIVGSEVQFLGVFAAIDKYFPKIRVESLPSNFPLGVYRFDFGGPTNIYFKKMILNATLGDNSSIDELSLLGDCQALGAMVDKATSGL